MLKALERDYELMITMTGAGHIPDIVKKLKYHEMEKEAIFMESSQEDFAEMVRKTDPGVSVDNLSSS